MRKLVIALALVISATAAQAQSVSEVLGMVTGAALCSQVGGGTGRMVAIATCSGIGGAMGRSYNRPNYPPSYEVVNNGSYATGNYSTGNMGVPTGYGPQVVYVQVPVQAQRQCVMEPLYDDRGRMVAQRQVCY